MRKSFDSMCLPQTLQNEAGPSKIGLPFYLYENKKLQVCVFTYRLHPIHMRSACNVIHLLTCERIRTLDLNRATVGICSFPTVNFYGRS